MADGNPDCWPKRLRPAPQPVTAKLESNGDGDGATDAGDGGDIGLGFSEPPGGDEETPDKEPEPAPPGEGVDEVPPPLVPVPLDVVVYVLPLAE